MKISKPGLTIASFLLLAFISTTKTQRTWLDDEFQPLIAPLRRLGLHIFGRTGENPNLKRNSRNLGKTQKLFPKTANFFCDTKNGRSKERPTSVHKLRPGDIDIIGAMGDSITAAYGAMSTNILQALVENRGMSWSIGGQGTWREFLTLPNILKEFNSNLYGYSLRDGVSSDRASRFNVAEGGAISADMPHQAELLVKRMRSDPKVNMTEHWKLVSLFIGGNDFCSFMCYTNNPKKEVIGSHTEDLLKAIRILRDSIPRLLVNILPPPNLRTLADLTGLPPHCAKAHLFLCPCLFGIVARTKLDFYTKLMNEWIKRDSEIVNRDEFNREDFTVNYIPFTSLLTFPKTKDGRANFEYMAMDCFHLSQKAHARSANAIWNGMLEREGERYPDWRQEFETFKCPTEENPYFFTRVNSKM